MKLKNILLCAAAITLSAVSPAVCGTLDRDAAEDIVKLLVKEFSPEHLEAEFSHDGKKAWVECTGIHIDGLRIESIKLDADLAGVPAESEDANLAELITSSRGELVLLERDVNDYFASGKSSGGFSNLKFKFSPKGFYAEGDFTADISVLKIDLDLTATGKLALESDGVYLSETVITANGSQTSESITDLVLSKVNPLLPFSKIPFPVTFTDLTMKDDRVILTGNPKKIVGKDVHKFSM